MTDAYGQEIRVGDILAISRGGYNCIGKVSHMSRSGNPIGNMVPYLRNRYEWDHNGNYVPVSTEPGVSLWKFQVIGPRSVIKLPDVPHGLPPSVLNLL